MFYFFNWSVGIESCSPLIMIEFFTVSMAYQLFIKGKTAHRLK